MLGQDIRYGLRMLARSPGFTLLVVAILTIGIGVNTAVFSVINTVLLKALPYDDPGEIVQIAELQKDLRLFPRTASPRTLAYWRDHNQAFDYVAGRTNREVCLTGLGEPLRVSAWAVSSCFFSLVGVSPQLGRRFLPEEEQPGCQRVMIVSYAFWQNHLNADPQAVGQSVTAEGESCTVVGVMPPGYRDTPGQKDVALWVPLVLNSVGAKEDIEVWARLKRGVSVERARADMAVLEQQLAQADPPSYQAIKVEVERVLDSWFGSERKLLYPLWGAVVLVLLIACMNVAGLFLVQGDARRQEMITRATLGASRGRILAHLLTESLLLSLTGGSLGILAAFWMIQGMVAVCPASVARIGATHMDRTVLFFTLGLSVLVGLAFGLLPAWRAGGMRPVRTVRGESSGPVLDRAWRRLCHGLVVAQIAVALTLLAGVGMLIQSLIRLHEEDLGFQPENVVVMHLKPPPSKYGQGARAVAFAEQLLQRLQALPQVRSAAAVCPYLCLGSRQDGAFIPLTIPGRPPEREGKTFARVQMVSADFFAALGIRIVQGRGFVEQDMQNPRAGLVVDENLARRYFPQGDAIGQRIALGGEEQGPIIGVVQSLKDYNALQPENVVVYWLLSQRFWMPTDVVVKANGDPLRLAPILRAQVADLDKDVEVSSLRTVEEGLSAMLATRRFALVLLGAFAQIALVVAALGLYGLLQYSVARRTHEIGVRMALGATPGGIIRTVLRQGGLLILLGAGLGLVGGYAMSQIIRSLLYESKPTDPIMLVIVLATLFVTGLGACYVPARRAAKVDPMVALRCE